MNYCDRQLIEEISGKFNRKGNESVDDLYRYLVPILFTGCLTGLILNVILLVTGHIWCHTKSPIFRLSLNLAITDAINSLIVGIGLVLNSYLPRLFGVGVPKCSLLVLEIFRLSSLVASALHLLAMALVYYKGTTRPLHYRFSIFCSTHLTRSIYLVSLSCWLLPIFIFTVYFSSISCQGFLSDKCDVTFLLSFKFRMTITGMFITPLVIMSVLYAKIFSVIRSRDQIIHTNRRPTILLEVVDNKHIRQSIRVREVKEDIGGHPEINNMDRLGVRCSSGSRRASIQTSIQSHKNHSYPRKAVITTLTILGTYVICWMPAVVFFGLTCIDGCPLPLNVIQVDTRVIIGFVTNAFIIIKAIVDPFIYSFRMKEINCVLQRTTLNNRSLLNSRSSPNTDTQPRDQRFLSAV